MIRTIAFLVAFLASLFCGTPTSWVDLTGDTPTAVCGDDDGNTVTVNLSDTAVKD